MITLDNGATISLTPAGTPVIVPGSGPSTTLGVASTNPGATVQGLASTTPAASPNVLTVNGQTITANPSSAFIIGGQTLVPGGPQITVSGTVISLGPGGTVIVIGGTTSTQLGSIINSIFSGTTTPKTQSTSTSAPAQYTGDANKFEAGKMKRLIVVVVVVLIVLHV